MRKFNLSLDDMSPHPKAGLNFESIDWCDRLIDRYPFIKINLFVPSMYCRLGEQQGKYAIIGHREWVDRLDHLPKSNYRVNFHGVHHSRQFYPYNQKRYQKYPPSNNDEWQYLTYDHAIELIKIMLADFKAMGLSHVRTFRPPGWKISKDAVRALQDAGFKTIAGSTEYYEKHKDVIRPDTKWVSYNWDLTGPCTIRGDVVAYGHTSDWTNNYMDKKRYHLIDDLLDSGAFDFRFIEEM